MGLLYHVVLEANDPASASYKLKQQQATPHERGAFTLFSPFTSALHLMPIGP